MASSPPRRSSKASTSHQYRKIPVEDRFDDPLARRDSSPIMFQTSPTAFASEKQSPLTPPQPQPPRMPLESPAAPEPTAVSPTSEDVAPEVFWQVLDRRLDEQVEELSQRLTADDLAGVKWRWTVFRHILTRFRQEANQRIDDLQMELRGRNDSTEQVSEAMREIRQDVAALTLQKHKLQQDKTSLTQEVKQLTEKMDSEYYARQKLEEEVKKLSDDLQRRTMRMDVLRQSVKRLEKRNVQVEAQLRTYQQHGSIQARTGELESLSNSATPSLPVGDTGDRTTRIAYLEDLLRHKNVEAESLSCKYITLIETLEKQRSEINSELSKLRDAKHA